MAVLLSLVAPGVDVAHASIKGASSDFAAMGASSGTWLAAVLASSADTTNPQSAYSFTTKVGSVDNFMSLRNFGTLSMVSATSTLTVGTDHKKDYQLQTCTGTWPDTTNSMTVTSYPMPIAVGASVRLRVLDNQSDKTDTLSISLARVDVQAATTTNS